ncbi:MAG: hypothetical protein GKR95_17550 [Gammaproteobacteria bacterium]|nr:hypothetical protein [Gammaproteobacteria bacterium]
MQEIIDAVQRNCDVADARYAGDDTLCIYLMKMRDLFRWAVDVPLGQVADRKILGNWIVEKEALWDELEEQEFVPIIINGQEFDPFDNDGINDILTEKGYVYSGGLGRRARPIYFLGKLVETEATENAKIWVSGTELARCITAPPAMSQGRSIYIRKDALKRYLGSMVEEWSWKKREGVMGEAVSHYDFDSDFYRALDEMVENEKENLILHEIGEQIAGELIGEGWQEMVASLEDPIQEMKARAVRDNLADCATTLPAFLTLKDQASIDFYYANMTALRKKLFPSFCSAYEDAHEQRDLKGMVNVINGGRRHWLSVGKKLVGSYERGEMEAIEHYLEHSDF